MNIKSIYYFICCILATHTSVIARSIFRPINESIPSITVTTTNQDFTQNFCKKILQPSYTLKSKFLRLKPLIKSFQKDLLERFTLPTTIKSRTTKQTYITSRLKEQAQACLQEIAQGKKIFTHFVVLKDRDFNYKNRAGLLVLKYKDFPFVLKLSIEHPHTVTNPFKKSFEASGIFMIGGAFRHITGFTRIHNRNEAQKAIQNDPSYKKFIDFPNKWFWVPCNTPDLVISWKNYLTQDTVSIVLPSVYGVIADFIEFDPIKNTDIGLRRSISIDVANYLHYTIDPHTDNFVFEKNTGKVVIIDTEHFPTVAGLEHTLDATSYLSWYLSLVQKCVKRIFCRNKKDLIQDAYII